MRCEEVRRALPLQGGTPDEDALVREHVKGCDDCGALAEAYEADARALAALRADREADMPPVMAGFADAVLKAVAEEPRETAGAEILRPEFGRVTAFPGVLAAAAVFLLAIALGILIPAAGSGEGPVVAETPPPVAPPEVAHQPEDAGQPLAAPRRVEDRAPMPRLDRSRRSRGIVPVGGGRRAEPPLADMLRDLQRVFPNWGPNGLDRRVPPLREGEREVRF